MLKSLLPVVFGLLITLATNTVAAQSGAGGHVSSIEQKAREIRAQEALIDRLKNRIQQLEIAKDAAVKKAKKAFEDALDFIKNDQSWKNRLETAKNGWEEYSPGTCSAGGPPPICVANHWFKTSLAEAMKKYEAYKETFLRPKRIASRNAGDRYDDDISQANKEITDANNKIDKLKAELIALSKRYEKAIEEDAAYKTKTSIKEMVHLLATLHYTADMIIRYDQLIAENSVKEAEQKQQAKEKVIKQLDELRNKIKKDIENIERFYDSEKNKLAAEWDKCDLDIATNDRKIQNLNQQLAGFAGTETARNNIEEEMKQLRSINYTLAQKKNQLDATIKTLPEKEREDTELLRQELFNLNSDSFNLVREAEKLVETAFNSKREILTQSKDEKIVLKQKQQQQYNTKLQEKDRAFKSWANVVDEERIRIMNACGSVKCSCYGTYVYNNIIGIWNKDKDCLSKLDNLRSNSGVLYGCEEYKSYYDTLYSGLKGNLSEDQQKKINDSRWQNRIENFPHSNN